MALRMIGAIAHRLKYVRLLVKPGFWRWMLSRVDLAVEDHALPWTQLRRPPDSTIHPTVSFRCAPTIVLGERIRVQNHCVLWSSPGSGIYIGDGTGLGPGVMAFSSNHTTRPGEPYVDQPWEEGGIRIGRNVWIGAGTILLAGAVIGDGCVVAAGSVVRGEIPPNSLAAGVPARVLRQLHDEPRSDVPSART